MLRTLPSALALSLLATCPAGAQAPDGGQHAGVPSRSHGVTADGGAITALGPGYKALFDRGGIAFTPALGADAPRSLPLRFTLESIRRGTDLVHEASSATRARRDGNAVTYARGPAITERYESRVDGVEQTFVFEEPLAGSGDLVVTGRIETDLRAAAEGDCTLGVTFESVWGGVCFGAVTGLDASGARQPGTLRLDGDRLELVLPASLVDGAAYPLVLDPLIGTSFGIGGTTSSDGNADVAYDATSDLYLVVWDRVFSGTDKDVMGQRVRRDGTLAGSLIGVTNNNRLAGLPSVASVDGTNEFFVAWLEAAMPGLPLTVRCRTVSATTGSLSGATDLSDPNTFNASVDVGGSIATNPVLPCNLAIGCSAFAVWSERGAGIKGQAVRITAGQAPVARFSIVDVTTDGRDGWPAISKNGGPAGEYLVVWQRDAAVSLVRGAVVNLLGQILHPLEKFGTNSIGRSRPDVDGDGTDFMVVFQRQEDPTSSLDDIYCWRAHWDGNDMTKPVPETVVWQRTTEADAEPGVSLLGAKYLVVWEGVIASRPYVITGAVDPTSCVPCGPRRTVSAASARFVKPSVASQRSGTPTPSDDHALIVFQEDASGGRGPIRGQSFEAVGGGGSVSDLGGGCGGGTSTATGSFAVGNPSFALILQNAPPAATGAWLNLNTAVSPVACGAGCAFTPPFIMIPAPLSGGTAAVPLPVPCETSLVGGTLVAQWWVLGGPTAPCLPGGITFSNRLSATVGS